MIDLRTRAFALILAAALISFTAGCGSSDDATPADAGSEAADAATDGGDSMAGTQSMPGVKTRIAKEGESVDLPDGYPPGFPLYPGARPTFAQDATASASVAFETKDAGADVYAYFSDQLPSDGWTIKLNTDLGGKYMISAEKDGREVSVYIPPAKDGMTAILLMAKS